MSTTRMTAGLLLGTFAMVGLTIAASVPQVGDESASVPLGDPRLLASMVATSFAVPGVLVVLLGVIAFTQEFRYGTATSMYLGEPRRERILVAKLLSLAAASVALSIATLVISLPICIVLIESRNGDASVGTRFWQTLPALFAFMLAYGAIGVAIGALVRHQIVAVTGVLIWMLAVEWTVLPPFPEIGRWLPAGATNSLLQLGPELQLELLSPWMGGIALVGYTAAAVGLALLVTPRRDIL
jgi:ABC-type transport system involved in multi-copper enzyme maturation permease subunit